MVRNIWIAIGAALWSGSVALAQLPGPGTPMPYGNPGVFGYPGYPMPPYGPPLPGGPGNAPPMGPGAAPMLPYGYPQPMMPMGPGGMMPYRPAMSPMPATPYSHPGAMGMMPYANPLPVPIPPDPRRPVGMPIHDDAGPRRGATEPYIVGPARNPTAAQSPSKGPTLPSATDVNPPAPTMPDSPVELASYGVSAPPAEPYTLYEGRRYLADVKQDKVCIWGDVSFIHWWARKDRVVPLLTTGNAANPNAGTAGNLDTAVLVGGALAPNEFSGVKAGFGIWLDPEKLTSVEFGGFYVGKNSRQYAVASDANGNNVIAQPVVAVFPPNTTYGEGSFFVAFPGLLAGNASFSSVMDFHGGELNIGRNLLRLNGWTLDVLAGFRYLYLNDTLTTNQNSTILAAGPAIPFLGAPQAPGANFVFSDSFNMTNRFYGGQIGARLDFVHCSKFDLGAAVKVGFGNTAHTFFVDGTTTLNTNGVSATAPGGAYAQPSNIGQHGSNDFTVVSELTVTVGYQIHSNIRLIAGYNLLYWPRIERAGEQIERTIDPGQSPTDPAFVAGTIGTFPRFLNARSDFWAQGINIGVEVKY